MGVLFAVKKWRQYLLRRECIIKTDHKPLKYLLEQRLHTETQHAWLLKLRNYKFVVEYKKGKENIASDGLSRREDSQEAIAVMIIAVESGWVKQLRLMVDMGSYSRN